VVYETLKARWELWYQYIVRFHAGGDNIRQKQLFSHVKRHDVLHISPPRTCLDLQPNTPKIMLNAFIS